MAVSHFDVSDNGQLLAYGLSTAGSDWQEWRVRDVTTGKDLSDHLKWIKFSSVSWTPDNKGFFYSRYAEPNEATKLVDTNYYQKLYYHRIGDSQALDQLVYERPDEKEWEFSGTASEDGKFLVIEVHHGTEQKNLVFYKRLDQPDAKVVELISEFKAKYDYLGNNGSVFWFRTDLDAPRGRIIAIDLERPEPANRRELVAESADVMAHAGVVGDQFIAENSKPAFFSGNPAFCMDMIGHY